jgi:hypothetical protein
LTPRSRAAAEIGQLVVGGVFYRVGACIAPEAIEIGMFLRRRVYHRFAYQYRKSIFLGI